MLHTSSSMVSIPPELTDFDLPIAGLCFQSNDVQSLNESSNWFSTKIFSSLGPLISDFVTHGADFEYSTYGIHVGQDDRLTFLGDSDREILGYFVDCRENSPTLHKSVACSFSPSASRKLVIPRGVAHTFDGLAEIVTRDEPVWYSHENNPHWNVNNDLISILRSSTDFPVVTINPHKLPDSLHVYLSRLSQSVLEEPKPYSTRFNLLIGGQEQYVMFQESAWEDEEKKTLPLLNKVQEPGLRAVRSKYAITGKASWTLVPNTGSGVADILTLEAQHIELNPAPLFLHHRTRKWYTFLTCEGAPLSLVVVDLRSDSESFGERREIQTVCDPRVTYVIEPGVAYSFAVRKNTFVRSENEVYVSEIEPREDLMPFGRDMVVIQPSGSLPEQPPLPELRCPDSVVRTMARVELNH